MAQKKMAYTCTACGYQHTKWFGCCPACQEWGTFTQQTEQETSNGPSLSVRIKHLDDERVPTITRCASGIGEWDRVLGGGLVPGSLIMLTGDPGIGKSTLLLQVSHALARQYTMIYVSSEESHEQVHKRAQRLQCTGHILFSDDAQLEHIEQIISQHRPDILVIDSIQNCRMSAEHSYATTQHLRTLAHTLMQRAKQHQVTIIISGHITKEGTAAGPKMLEHMVDAVVYLQGEEQWNTRVLRSVKNRFGATDELGFFDMTEHGLEEIADINRHMLSDITHSPGAILTSSCEGSRPILVELQALTIRSQQHMPQRIISGIDHKQVMLIAAIIEKYLEVPLSSHDIFFKVSGGLKLTSHASDLGIALSLLSSFFQQPLPEKSLAIGEMRLTGHIKPAHKMQQYIREAEKFGIHHLCIAKTPQAQTKTCRAMSFSTTRDLLTLFT